MKTSERSTDNNPYVEKASEPISPQGDEYWGNPGSTGSEGAAH